MTPCSLPELIRRGQAAGLLPAGLKSTNENYPNSGSEFLAGQLQLAEETMFKLLALEHSLDYIPLPLVDAMDIPLHYRNEEDLTVFRREGFAPVEDNGNSVLVVLVYPFTVGVNESINAHFQQSIEIVLCTDRNLGSILNRSVEVGEATEFESEDSVFLGADNDEDAFPGLYGGGAADVLYEEDNKAADGSTTQRSMKGHLEDLAFGDMVQMISNSRKTATVHIESEETGDIYLFFQNGQIIHCSTEYGSGEESFYRIIGITKGKFDVVTGTAEAEQTIFGTTEGLLLEGFRRLDEKNQ